MGNCCSTENPRAGDEQIFQISEDVNNKSPTRIKAKQPPSNLAPRSAPPSPQATQASKGQTTKGSNLPPPLLDTFIKKLSDTSIEILVLLANGLGIESKLKMEKGGKALQLTRDNHTKEISLSQITAILHTKDQLSKIETKANIARDHTNCSAIVLSSGNCITFRFETPEDNNAFVALVESELQKR